MTDTSKFRVVLHGNGEFVELLNAEGIAIPFEVVMMSEVEEFKHWSDPSSVDAAEEVHYDSADDGEIIEDDAGTASCSECGTVSAALKPCNGCHAAFYCNQDCQRKDWNKGHMDTCTELKAGQDARIGGGGQRSTPPPRRRSRSPGTRSRTRSRSPSYRRRSRSPYRPGRRYGGRYYRSWRGPGAYWYWRSLLNPYGYYNPTLYNRYQEWYPDYYDYPLASGPALPTLPSFDPKLGPDVIQNQLVRLRKNNARAGYMIVPDYQSGRFIWVQPMY